MFWIPRGFFHGEEERVDQQWAYLQKFNYDFDRVLFDVGWGNDLEINYTWPGYAQKFADMLDWSWKKRGIRTMVTLWGGSDRDPLRAADMLVEIIKGREDSIMYLEGSNEGQLKDQDIAVKVCKKLMATGCLVAPGFGDTYGTNMVEVLAKGGGNMASVHLSRTTSDFDWRFVRQGWDVKDYKWPTALGEGKGPLSSVASCSDPLRLTMSRLVGMVCGGKSFIVHNGAGIYGKAMPGSTGWRPANLEETPGIDAVMTAVRGVDVLMPENVERWVKSNDGWAIPPHPLKCQEFWEGKEGKGLNKNYAAIGGNEFITAPCGVLNEGHVKALNACHVTIYDPLHPQEPVEMRDLGAGEILTLKGDAGANAAYLIHGVRL